jgi:hypothetical protein
MDLALLYHNEKTKAITIFWNIWMLKSALHPKREKFIVNFSSGKSFLFQSQDEATARV